MIIIIINIITTTTTIIIISYIIVNNMNIITNINKIIQMAENAENRPWLSFGTHNTLGHNRHCLLRAKGHSWPKNLVLGRHGRQPSSSSRPGCFCSPNNKFCLGFLSEMSVVYVSVLQNLLLPVLTASPLFWWRALQKFQTFFWLIEYQQLAFQRRSRVGIRERCFCVSFFVIFLQIPRFSPRFPRNPKFTSFFVIFFYFFVIKTLFSMQNENFSPAGPKFSTPLETAHPGGAPKGFHTPFALFFFRVAFWMPILHPPPPPGRSLTGFDQPFSGGEAPLLPGRGLARRAAGGVPPRCIPARATQRPRRGGGRQPEGLPAAPALAPTSPSSTPSGVAFWGRPHPGVIFQEIFPMLQAILKPFFFHFPGCPGIEPTFCFWVWSIMNKSQRFCFEFRLERQCSSDAVSFLPGVGLLLPRAFLLRRRKFCQSENLKAFNGILRHFKALGQKL